MTTKKTPKKVVPLTRPPMKTRVKAVVEKVKDRENKLGRDIFT